MANDTRPLTEQWRQDLDGQWSHPQWWQAEQAQVAQVGNGGQTKQYGPRPHITTRKASRQAAPPTPYYPYYPDAVGAVTIGGCNHVLHAILTVLTLGAWWPIWVLVAIFSRRRVAVVSRYGQVIATRRL